MSLKITVCIAVLEVTLVLFVAPLCAEQCDDIDQSLCSMMINKIPELCSDSCLAKHCKRSCGLCPLQCYDCAEIADVSRCTNVKTCSDPTDYCYSAQTFTAHFTETYSLGCGSRQTCLQYINGNKRASVEAGCCNSDRCNNKPPPILQLSPSKNYSIVGSLPTSPSVCENKDGEVCTALTLHMVKPCADDCIATHVCPKMCGTCFNCLDCFEVENPANCTQTTACGFGKECYGMEKLGSDFTKTVQLGCVDKNLCSQLYSQPEHLFGKRDGDFNLRGECCIGEKCNAHHISTSQATTKTTTQPTTSTIRTTVKPHHQCPTYRYHCPPGFVRHQYVHGNRHTGCYLFDDRKVTKHEAMEFCKSKCADLFFTDTMDELQFLYNQTYMTNSITEVYTDMERKSYDRWIHTHNNNTAFRSVVTHIKHREFHDCATAIYNYNAYQQRASTYFQAVECDSFKHPFCKILLH